MHRRIFLFIGQFLLKTESSPLKIARAAGMVTAAKIAGPTPITLFTNSKIPIDKLLSFV